MVINMTVTQNEEGKDVFRLLADNCIDVDVTEEKGTEQLKAMFGELLKAMLTEEVTIEFEKTEDYKNKMYEDVCEAYIAVLNEELRQSRENLLREGLCVTTQ